MTDVAAQNDPSGPSLQHRRSLVGLGNTLGDKPGQNPGFPGRNLERDQTQRGRGPSQDRRKETRIFNSARLLSTQHLFHVQCFTRQSGLEETASLYAGDGLNASLLALSRTGSWFSEFLTWRMKESSSLEDLSDREADAHQAGGHHEDREDFLLRRHEGGKKEPNPPLKKTKPHHQR